MLICVKNQGGKVIKKKIKIFRPHSWSKQIICSIGWGNHVRLRLWRRGPPIKEVKDAVVTTKDGATASDKVVTTGSLRFYPAKEVRGEWRIRQVSKDEAWSGPSVTRYTEPDLLSLSVWLDSGVYSPAPWARVCKVVPLSLYVVILFAIGWALKPRDTTYQFPALASAEKGVSSKVVAPFLTGKSYCDVHSSILVQRPLSPSVLKCSNELHGEYQLIWKQMKRMYEVKNNK